MKNMNKNEGGEEAKEAKEAKEGWWRKGRGWWRKGRGKMEGEERKKCSKKR